MSEYNYKNFKLESECDVNMSTLKDSGDYKIFKIEKGYKNKGAYIRLNLGGLCRLRQKLSG